MKLTIKNVYHPLFRKKMDVVINDGKIESILYVNSHTSEDYEDFDGYVILPTLIDAHAHLDKTVYGMDWFENKNGPTLEDKINNERVMRRVFGIDAQAQASGLVELFLKQGVLAIRSHVDIDNINGLDGFYGVQAAKEKYKEFIKIETVAFPQSGLVSRKGTYELMDEALAKGADLVGGLDPANIDRDPKGSLDAVFALAQKHAKPIDIHLHEAGELGAFDLELIIERTMALGMQGKVSISHALCLGSIDTRLTKPLYEKIAKAEINIITAAQPGLTTAPLLKPLMDSGIKLCAGNDNIIDMWGPFGTGDMLERAQFIAMKNNFRADSDLELSLDACTYNNAKLLTIDNYGIEEGCCADFVLARGRNVAESVALHSADRVVFKSGRIIARNGKLVSF